jgi:hypothetical protein
MFRILFLIWFSFHPVHVTLTSIDYIPETDSFKGFVRLYLDDFLLDCGKQGYNIAQEKFVGKDPSALKELEKYLNEKLIISVNKKPIKGVIREIQIEDNEVDINLHFNNGKHPDIITVKNIIMTDLYADQANMVIVKVADFEEGVKLTPGLTEQTFKIN